MSFVMLNKFKSVYQYLIKADVEQRPIRDVYDFVTDSEIMFACAIEACISNISSLQDLLAAACSLASSYTHSLALLGVST